MRYDGGKNGLNRSVGEKQIMTEDKVKDSIARTLLFRVARQYYLSNMVEETPSKKKNDEKERWGG